MNRNYEILLDPQTGAGTSGEIALTRNKLPATFFAGNTTLAGEKITIQVWDGQAFRNLYVGGVLQEAVYQIDTAITVYGPGTYRAVKSITAQDAGIYVCPAYS
jgi:tellurite resistance-related uncharacterized protein